MVVFMSVLYQVGVRMSSALRKFIESVVEDLHLYCSVSDCFDQSNPSSLDADYAKFG